MARFLLGQPLTLLSHLLSRRAEPLSLGQSPGCHRMLPLPPGCDRTPPPPPPPLLGLSSDPAAPGSSPGVLRGCVLPGPPWPSAKRNQKIRAQGLSLGCSHSGPSLERGPSSLKQCRTREGEQGLLCASQGSQQPRESNFRGTEKLALPKIAPLPAH